jgi:hypothetical protein
LRPRTARFARLALYRGKVANRPTAARMFAPTCRTTLAGSSRPVVQGSLTRTAAIRTGPRRADRRTRRGHPADELRPRLRPW